jgi:hypothetical protein
MKFTRKIAKELLVEMFLFMTGTLLVSLLYPYTELLFVTLLFAGAITLKLWHKKDDVYYFILGATLGPFAEIFHIYFGVWQYTTPHFLGLPIWLPLGWGLFIIILNRVVGTIKKMF